MKIYLVGGAVRDRLLNCTFYERDWVVVGATPEKLSSEGYLPVGKDFPVFLHPQTKEEYALARTERKSGHGYAGFEFYTGVDVSLEQDLGRRDLTINAIAQSADGELIDPYNGQADLQQKVLRHVSAAFAEDPLRVLRVARFAARFDHLGFRIADETMQLMREIVDAGEMDYLVAERVWKEMSRALLMPSPAVFFRTLRACGALEKLMPELDNLFGVPQPAKHHPEIDTGIHTLMCLEQAALLSDKLSVRFATLLHDLGKGVTEKALWPKHIAHEKRGVGLVKTLCQRLKVPKECLNLALLATEYHTHCHKAFELKPQTVLRLFERVDALRRPERFKDFLLCCEADSRGREGLEQRPYPQAGYLWQMYQKASAIRAGAECFAGREGKALGEALSRERVRVMAVFKQSVKAAS